MCIRDRFLYVLKRKNSVYTIEIFFRGRHGFDVGHETGGACRGADYLVNTTANILVANEDNYALAA